MNNPLKAKSVRIEWHDIDAFNEDLQSFPAKPASHPTTASARQTIAELYDTLVFLRQERNYKYEDLAYHLEQRLALKLSPSTVKSYMDLAAKKRRQSSSKKVSPPATQTIPRSLSSPPIEPSSGTPIVEPVPIVSLPLEAAAPLPPPETEITSAIVEVTSPETPPKSSLRPGEWSPAELRKHFNKY
jgi:hypothetical protein